MGVLNDFGCRRCDSELRNVVLPSGKSPVCCDEPMTTLWDHGKAPATDLHEPVFNHATGEFHRSTREAEMVLARQAREWSDKTGMKYVQPIQAGDKVGGARYESAQKHRAYGYRGQVSRTSTEERRSSRGVRDSTVSTPAPQPSDYTVSGVAPMRMTRDQAANDRKATTFRESP